MRLPDIREEMHKLAHDIAAAGLREKADRLAYLAEETRRRSPLKRAPPRARMMTEEVKALVRQTARDNPGMSLREIGRKCGVDQGRVSEVLRGFRQ
jgi:hypothetical protein